MEQHVKAVAILNIVLGALGVCVALVILLIFGGLAGVSVLDDDADAGVLGLIGGMASFIVAVLSVPSLIAGIGLLSFRPWAKTLMLVVSALHIFNVPLGTALGIYGFWVLLKDETQALIRAKQLA